MTQHDRRKTSATAPKSARFGRNVTAPRSAWIGSLLFAAIGVVVLSTMWLLPETVAPRTTMMLLAFEALAVAGVLPLFPWDRWSQRWLLAFATVGFAILGAGNYYIPSTPNPYGSLFIVMFLFIGLTQPPRTGLLMLPVGLGAFVGSEVLAGSELELILISAAIATPIWLVVAETASLANERLRSAQRGAARLLEAGTTLARAETETEAAELVADLAVDLLAADTSVVLVADDPNSARLVNVAQHGFDVPLRKFSIDPGDDPWRSLLHEEEATWIARQTPPNAVSTHLGARSMLVVPLIGEEGPQGIAVAGWNARKSRLESFRQQAVELISDESGRVIGRLRMQHRLVAAVEIDPLTNLANRRGYDRALELMVPGDGVVMIDLDHFKNVNDSLGHAVGDEILQSLAECMQMVARRDDCVARYGGEEFALVFSGAGRDGAIRATERLRSIWNQANPVTTFSAGISVHVEDAAPADTVAQADAALYKAKELGRDRTEVASQIGPGGRDTETG